MTTRFTAVLRVEERMAATPGNTKRMPSPCTIGRSQAAHRRFEFMRSPFFIRLLACLLASTLAAAAPIARAAFQIEQLYSNADGTVQYLVLHETAGSDGLQGLHLTALTSNHSG